MRRSFPLAFKPRLLLAFAAFLILLAGLSLWIAARARDALEQELDSKLIAVAAAASDVTIVSPVQLPFILNAGPGDETTRTYRIVQDRLRRLTGATGVERIGVWDFTGRVLVDSDTTTTPGRSDVTAQLYRGHLQRAAEGEASASFLFEGEEGRIYKKGFYPLVREGEPQAVIVAEGNARFLASAARLRRVLIGVGIAALLLGSLAAWGLAVNVTRPLERMSRAARHIGAGDLDTPVPTTGPAETQELARAMERMRGDLRQRDQQLRAMVAGVAHEIRNPLGGLVLYADLLAQDESLSAEGRRQAAKILNEAGILNRIVEEFMIFARPAEPLDEEIDLEELWNDVRPLVEARLDEGRPGGAPSIEWIRAGSVRTLRADPRHLRQILLNLTLNAAEALNRGGGRIELAGRREGDEVVLEVGDSGPGIDPAHYEEALRPFATTKSRGAGLGLPMVEHLARAGGGSIELDRSRLGGLAVRVSLPQTQGEDSAEKPA
ncbi:MAG: HAMP domain-containing protein [Candidatus Eisenbacteria bacterium]|nr:HAMP domain-containing protein [Candidatus Eisenbacteria bacterium]